MKFSEQWLREWAPVSLSRELLLARLTAIGLEVESAAAFNEDYAIEIGLTPNRGDCLSIKGLARDLLAAEGQMLQEQTPILIRAVQETSLAVQVDESAACPRYLARPIFKVNAAQSSPAWLRHRLEASGIASISVVVDVLNYVMLELGQPMHAFDFNKLQGKIHVRYAKKGETLLLLDNQEVTLLPDTLVIADEEGPLAIAGIMGGLASSVTEMTTTVLLESAFFTPASVANRAKHYGLHTESAHRFERGVDFNLPRQAIEKATKMIVDITGGEPGAITEIISENQLPRRPSIAFSLARMNRFLGLTLPMEAATGYFTHLGFSMTSIGSDQCQVGIPSYRFDIQIEEDLIEEVARLVGYDRIPVMHYQAELKPYALPERELSEWAAKNLLQTLGFHEAVTYSFVSAAQQQCLDPHQTPIFLVNPISVDMAVMRTSLWPGLLAALDYNLKRQQPRVRLFELGRVFLPQANALHQPMHLAGVMTGARWPEQWGQATVPIDFYDMKGELEHLLGLTRRSVSFELYEGAALHPGQSASILLEGKKIGECGALHPAMAKRLGFKPGVFLFELNWEHFAQINPCVFKEVSKYPAVRRDFAFVVDKMVSVEALLGTISEIAADLLVDITVFDVFTGKGLAENQRSIAIGLTLQHPLRTLADEEVSQLSHTIITTLHEQYAAILRE